MRFGFVALAALMAAFTFASCGGSGSECDSLTSARWQKAGASEREELAKQLSTCGTMTGWSKREAVHWLGKPDFAEGGDLYWRLSSDYLDEPRFMALDIEAGKVEGITVP